MANFVMTISGNSLESNIILDSDFATINDYQVNATNNLLLFNDDYADVIDNSITLVPNQVDPTGNIVPLDTSPGGTPIISEPEPDGPEPGRTRTRTRARTRTRTRTRTRANCASLQLVSGNLPNWMQPIF